MVLVCGNIAHARNLKEKRSCWFRLTGRSHVRTMGHKGVSKDQEPQYEPQNSRDLLARAPKTWTPKEQKQL